MSLLFHSVGDNGTCECNAYCRTNWNNENRAQHSSWLGARCVDGYNTVTKQKVGCGARTWPSKRTEHIIKKIVKAFTCRLQSLQS